MGRDTPPQPPLPPGFAPMLAKTYDPDTREAASVFPCLVQSKLDGVRMLCVLRPEGCGLYSRAGNPFDHLLPWFAPDLARVKKKSSGGGEGVVVVLDGELFGGPHMGFQTVVSLVKNRSPDTARAGLQYHVYDAYDPAHPSRPYSERERWLRAALPSSRTVRLVGSRRAASAAEAEALMDAAIREGYEGIMLRDPAAPYQPGKRSPALLKYKRFRDQEFRIAAVEEATGKDAGTAIFVCRTDAGREFRVRPMGTLAERRAMLRARPVGKRLTVRFQELTADGVPRFPVGVAVRDYE